MSLYPNPLLIQIDLIEKAMKEAGVWSQEVPDWAIQYHAGTIPDIWQWLQFIYLPLRLHGQIVQPHYLAPIVRPFIKSEPKKSNLLQLVIELDSITSTIEKK